MVNAVEQTQLGHILNFFTLFFIRISFGLHCAILGSFSEKQRVLTRELGDLPKTLCLGFLIACDAVFQVYPMLSVPVPVLHT